MHYIIVISLSIVKVKPDFPGVLQKNMRFARTIAKTVRYGLLMGGHGGGGERLHCAGVLCGPEDRRRRTGFPAAPPKDRPDLEAESAGKGGPAACGKGEGYHLNIYAAPQKGKTLAGEAGTAENCLNILNREFFCAILNTNSAACDRRAALAESSRCCERGFSAAALCFS